MKTTRGGWNLTVITLAVVFTLLQTAVTKSIFHEYDFSNPQNAIYSFTTNKLDFRVFKFYMSNHTNVQYFATRFEACTGQIFSLAVKTCNPRTENCDDSVNWIPTFINADFIDDRLSDVKWLCEDKKCSSDLIYYASFEGDDQHHYQMLTRTFTKDQPHETGLFVRTRDSLQITTYSNSTQIQLQSATYCSNSTRSGVCQNASIIPKTAYTIYYVKTDHVARDNINMRTGCGLRLCKSCQKMEIKLKDQVSDVITTRFDPNDYYKYIVNILVTTTDARFAPIDRMAYIPFEYVEYRNGDVSRSDLMRMWIVILVVVGFVLFVGPVSIILFYFRVMKKVENELVNGNYTHSTTESI